MHPKRQCVVVALFASLSVWCGFSWTSGTTLLFPLHPHHTKTGTHVEAMSGTPLRRPSTTDGKDLRKGTRDDEQVVG